MQGLLVGLDAVPALIFRKVAMPISRRQLVQSAALMPFAAALPGHAQAMNAIPGTPAFPTNLSAYGHYLLPDIGWFYAQAFSLPNRAAGTFGLYVEFDIDNFADYVTTNAVGGKHFAINLYDNKTVAPFTGRAGTAYDTGEGFRSDAISTGVGVAIGNLPFNGTLYQCAWLESFRKGNLPDCQKDIGSPNRDKILLDYGLGVLSGLVNQVTVKVWASKTPSGRYDIGVQIVNRANGASLFSGSSPNSAAVAVYDATGYRVTGANAGSTDTTKTTEYSFGAPVVSVIAVTNGNVGVGIYDTPRISAGRYQFY